MVNALLDSLLGTDNFIIAKKMGRNNRQQNLG